jgi:hypothetical protein
MGTRPAPDAQERIDNLRIQALHFAMKVPGPGPVLERAEAYLKFILGENGSSDTDG